jgi:hypothetical protein
MKTFFTIVICFSCLTLFGQKIELFGGQNKNTFFNSAQTSGHFNSSYNSGSGFFAGIGVDSVKVDWMTMRFTLQLEKYGGKLEASDGGLGGGNSTHASIDKSIITLGLFPLNFRILKKIDLNLGLEISRLLDESFNGTIGGWMMGQPNWSENLQDKYSRFSSLSYFGIRGKISYDFLLTHSIIISPQFSYYYGLSGEFDEFPTETKSMRYSFGLGLKKEIK